MEWKIDRDRGIKTIRSMLQSNTEKEHEWYTSRRLFTNRANRSRRPQSSTIYVYIHVDCRWWTSVCLLSHSIYKWRLFSKERRRKNWTRKQIERLFSKIFSIKFPFHSIWHRNSFEYNNVCMYSGEFSLFFVLLRIRIPCRIAAKEMKVLIRIRCLFARCGICDVNEIAKRYHWKWKVETREI